MTNKQYIIYLKKGVIAIVTLFYFLNTFLLAKVYSEQNFENVGLVSKISHNKSPIVSFTKEKVKEEMQLGLQNVRNDFTETTFTVNASIGNNNNSLDLARVTLKPNLSEMINASQEISTIYTPYILENKDICAEVKTLSVLVIIHTAVLNFEKRLLIRSTWANNTYFRHLGTIRTLFLLGNPEDKRKQKEIENEFNDYKDILQGDFSDNYHNLTLKGVMAYKWITERCRKAKIILKTDDDVVVNMFRFFSDIFPAYMNKSRQIVCSYRRQGTAYIFREKSSPWFVSDDHFRGLLVYPTTYCRGFMVIITSDFIPALYSSSKVTPFFWVDDVYLYGLVPGNVPGVQYNYPEGLNLYIALDAQGALKCYRRQTPDCNYLVAGAETGQDFKEIWSHIVKQQGFVMS